MAFVGSGGGGKLLTPFFRFNKHASKDQDQIQDRRFRGADGPDPANRGVSLELVLIQRFHWVRVYITDILADSQLLAATFSRFWPHRKVACSNGDFFFSELQVRLVSVRSVIVRWNAAGSAPSSPGRDLSALAGLFAALRRIADVQK